MVGIWRRGCALKYYVVLEIFKESEQFLKTDWCFIYVGWLFGELVLDLYIYIHNIYTFVHVCMCVFTNL